MYKIIFEDEEMTTETESAFRYHQTDIKCFNSLEDAMKVFNEFKPDYYLDGNIPIIKTMYRSIATLYEVAEDGDLIHIDSK